MRLPAATDRRRIDADSIVSGFNTVVVAPKSCGTIHALYSTRFLYFPQFEVITKPCRTAFNVSPVSGFHLFTRCLPLDGTLARSAVRVCCRHLKSLQSQPPSLALTYNNPATGQYPYIPYIWHVRPWTWTRPSHLHTLLHTFLLL